jgi:hypothetical protein
MDKLMSKINSIDAYLSNSPLVFLVIVFLVIVVSYLFASILTHSIYGNISKEKPE